MSAGGFFVISAQEEMLQQRWMTATSRQLWANSSDNLSVEGFSNICLPPGRDINDFKHKPNLCCQLCCLGSLFRKYGKRKAMCCCAAKHGNCGIQPPERLSLKTLSQFPFYVFNHLLGFYIPDIFYLHRIDIYLAFNIYLLLVFCSSLYLYHTSPLNLLQLFYFEVLINS